MKKLLFHYILILILATQSLIICAQSNKKGIPDIQRFSRREYGAATQNWKITQSKYNYLYCANNDGMLEYDGESWTLYKDMGSSILRSVYASDDRIYVGSVNELGYYTYNDANKLEYFSYADKADLKTMGDYWNILEWDNKIVFHSQQSLSFFQNDSLLFSIIPPSSLIACFYVNELLIVQDEKEGLMEVRGQQLFPIPGGKFFKGKMIGSMMSLSNGEILIGTMRAGSFIWDMNSFEPWQGEANKILHEANIFCGTRYNKDLLVFGTIQKGIVITDNNGKLIMHIDKDKGLGNNTVLSVHVDNEGNIWCGLDNGIAQISMKDGITFLSSYFDLGTGYTINKYKSDWYFGTNQGLFTITDVKLNNPEKNSEDFKKIEGTDGQVWSFYKDDTGILCGHNLGVFEIQNGESKLITPAHIRGIWNFKTIPGKPGFLICGSYSGLILLQKKGNKWHFYKQLSDFSESSRYIEWDNLNNLWISHGSKGIYKLSFSKTKEEVEKVEHFNTDYFSKKSGVVLSKITDQIVIVCKDKLFTINESGQVGNYNILNKYFTEGEFPQRLVQDKLGNIWYYYANDVGVLRLLENGKYQKIANPFAPIEQKLVSSFESIYVSDEKNTFFGIEDGFAHYLAEDNANFRLPVQVHLRMFKSSNDTISWALNQAVDNKQVQLNKPKFLYQNNSFELSYAAPFYDDSYIMYQTQLLGVDKVPTEWSRNNTREFTKLREGKYQFNIVAKNCYGNTSPTLKYQFEVAPPWHRSNTAKIIYLILIILIGATLVYVFNKRVAANRIREKIKQQELFKTKEEQLTQETLRAEKEIIRMRNEKLRNEMVHKEKELANSTMSIIHKNDFLAQIKENLKAIKKVTDVSQLQQRVNRIIKNIDKDIDSESYWEIFEVHLEHIHEDFLKRLVKEHADLNPKEKKLCAYIRMGMTSKEIASLMNISAPTVDNNRYKLRQKLNIEQGESLTKYIDKM